MFTHIGLNVLTFSILTALYGFIYVIIQLQDLSLLMGSVGSFVILAIVMYLSRNVDWFKAGRIKIDS